MLKLNDSDFLSDEERAALAEDGEDSATVVLDEAAVPDDTPPPADEDDTTSPFLPTFRAEPVADYDTKMAALDKAFEDGDLKLVDYNRQRDDLVAQRLKADIASEQNAQLAQQRWQWEVSRFKSDTLRAEKIDYSKPILEAALDTAVITLANAKDAQGNLLHADKDGEWILREAHKQVKAELGLRSPTTPRTPPPSKRDVPVTLSQVPQADVPNTGVEDPFAHIDKMFAQGKTEQAEMALAQMSKADQDRYLMAS